MKFIILLFFTFNIYAADIGKVINIYFTPSNDCENLVINQIKEAKDSIDIAIYSITSKEIVEAIKNAYDNNIKVQIIADKLQSKGKSSLVKEIIEYKIPLRINKKHRIEHNKFTIIDDKFVITGSYNYTNNAKKNNSENCLLIEDYLMNYKDRFNYLWGLYG